MTLRRFLLFYTFYIFSLALTLVHFFYIGSLVTFVLSDTQFGICILDPLEMGQIQARRSRRDK